MKDKELELKTAGFLRISQVLELFPVSKATWWAGVKSGRFPKSYKLGPKVTAWRIEDIRALLQAPSEKKFDGEGSE